MGVSSRQLGLVLDAQDICVAYGSARVLSGVAVRLHRSGSNGSITCLLGPSGIGKSSLLRVLVGLQAPESGTIEVSGGGHVGMLAQHYPLFQHRTAQGNIETAARCAGCGDHESRTVASGLLGELGLADCARHYPAQLSGGQRQRVALAQQLAARPDALLLDEPTTGLDILSIARVIEMIRTVADKHGTPILIATHDLLFALEIADRILLLGRANGNGASIVDEHDVVRFRADEQLTQLETTIRRQFRGL